MRLVKIFGVLSMLAFTSLAYARGYDVYVRGDHDPRNRNDQAVRDALNGANNGNPLNNGDSVTVTNPDEGSFCDWGWNDGWTEGNSGGGGPGCGEHPGSHCPSPE